MEVLGTGKFGNVSEDQVEALVSCSQGVHTGTTCPNLQLKPHEKKEEGEHEPKRKVTKLNNEEGKDTNFGNVLLDARY